MTDGPHAEALSQARRRLNELLEGLADADDSTGLVTHCRDLVAALDDLIGFLSPESSENDERFEKAFTSVVGNNGGPELERMISELQREANEAILFLENADLTASSTLSFLKADDEGRIALLSSERSVRDNLLQEHSSLITTINQNESQLEQLDYEIAMASAEAQRLTEVLRQADLNASQSPYSSAVEIDNESSMKKAIYRSATASQLLAALDVSPLKVVDEGLDYIVYEYTLEGSRRMLRVQDVGSGKLSFILDPPDAKAHAYLIEHLHSCTSRVQIAAVLQEALSLP